MAANEKPAGKPENTPAATSLPKLLTAAFTVVRRNPNGGENFIRYDGNFLVISTPFGAEESVLSFICSGIPTTFPVSEVVSIEMHLINWPIKE